MSERYRTADGIGSCSVTAIVYCRNTKSCTVKAIYGRLPKDLMILDFTRAQHRCGHFIGAEEHCTGLNDDGSEIKS
jgi:hypothetical protein